MIQDTLPVYETHDSNLFLSLDGRLGVIAQISTNEELINAYIDTCKKLPQYHIQAILFQNMFFLTVSDYLATPMDSVTATLLVPRHSTLETRATEVATELEKLSQTYTLLQEYPEVPVCDARHLYKLKYSIPLEKSAEIAWLDGTCLIHFPNESNSKLMYFASEKLRDLLIQRILCIEFVENFKKTAYQFWLPLGASQYFASLFKL